MKIAALMENTASSPRYLCRHGLSLYAETKKHKILFDMGPDEGFLENARELGIDLSQVDIAFLSHGHSDHGGGLEAFLQINEKAQVHVQSCAFKKYYAHDKNPERIRYIGLNRQLEIHPRIVMHSGDYRIDEELQIFSGITGRICASPANDSLYEEKGKEQVPDVFRHEQNLLIDQNEETILLSGCSHNGIVNILNRAEEISPGQITKVIGGLHLKGILEDDWEAGERFCRELSQYLQSRTCTYYTCHCTGLDAYGVLKEIMGEQICYLSAGDSLEF